MKKCVIAFVVTLLAGFIGMLIDDSLGMDGNFSIVCSVAAMGSIVIYYNNRK